MGPPRSYQTSFWSIKTDCLKFGVTFLWERKRRRQGSEDIYYNTCSSLEINDTVCLHGGPTKPRKGKQFEISSIEEKERKWERKNEVGRMPGNIGAKNVKKMIVEKLISRFEKKISICVEK